jgi:hypothetical protein
MKVRKSEIVRNWQFRPSSEGPKLIGGYVIPPISDHARTGPITDIKTIEQLALDTLPHLPAADL